MSLWRPMLRSGAPAALAVAVVLAGVGCTQVQRLLGRYLQRPTLHFQSAALRDVSLSGLTIDLKWRIENPNSVGVRLDRLTYAFAVDGNRLTRGVADQGIELVARGSSEVTLPFEVEFAELGSIASVLGRDSFSWLAEGAMGFDTPVGFLSVPYKREGTSDLPKLPRIGVSGVRLTQVGITGASVAFDMEIHNPNSFAIPLDRIAYSVRTAGREIASGTAVPPDLSSGQKRTFSLPVHLSFSGAGRALQHALQHGGADITFSGSVSAGPVDVPLNVTHRLSTR